MTKGKISVQTENIFPIIKKFLYSEREIFIRELVSNAVDATKKLKALASAGEYKGELGNLTIEVKIDKKKKTITVSDHGIGMTQDEVEKYINQIAFSSAQEFIQKYKNATETLIGQFGLGFYSAFMVSDKVEILTKSYIDEAKSVRWECEGNPEYKIEEIDKAERGTDVILHIDKDSEEFLEDAKMRELLKKYSRFLPVPIKFGEEDEYDSEGKKTGKKKDIIINNTEPLWTKKPTDLKDEDYKKFYRELYPLNEEPLFFIHLNVDYPFKLTGILYFPKIQQYFHDFRKDKIQLYCNQVFVTDSVEAIVPEFLTLLHGVIDSPDIPLNVSRSYLQGDPNVKKISSHITKKVSDKLEEIFKKDRADLEKKWDDIKIFIQYGMLTDEKFFERAEKFFLFKNIDGKYFTPDEYKNHIKALQTDRNKILVYLYSTDKQEQYSFIASAKEHGYDVLLMDGYLDAHFIQHLEYKWEKVSFKRVDASTIDKLINKEDSLPSRLSDDEQENLKLIFESHLDMNKFTIMTENLNETESPVIITQPEYIRRMKDMSKIRGVFAGDFVEMYNLVINTNHPLINKILIEQKNSIGTKVNELPSNLKKLNAQLSELTKDDKTKKENEEKIKNIQNEIDETTKQRQDLLKNFGKEHQWVKQLIDIALLSQNMLIGEDLTKFIKRSIEMIK